MKPKGAGKVETKKSRNKSMKKTSPGHCKKVSGLIIQKPTPIGKKSAPAVRD